MITSPLRYVGLTVLLLALGCEADPTADRGDRKPVPKEQTVEAKKVLVGPNVFLEVQGDKRRVLVSGSICLREGLLELFMCRKQTKEHEAIVTAEVDGRDIHKALILAGATEGSPVQFQPKYIPATGQTIKVSVQYENKGKLTTVSARSWIKNLKTKKELDTDWVFAGSKLVANPLDPDKPKIYLANDGDLICVSNFDTAMLDLPIVSSKDNSELTFGAWTERIPPLETKVVVILEPVPGFRKGK
jgi:hypothetical protein